MNDFIASARKYRPKDFKDVVGQEGITITLQKALDNNQLSHAMLFCGPHGVGKTTCARILARKINLNNNTVQDNEEFNFNIFELDAASNNSVEDIRALNEQIRYAPQLGGYKVYIIDEVHMLSTAAFNAFLKTLEEPPNYVIFILATTEKHKVLPTILSRCQIFDFKRIDSFTIVKHLQNIAKYEKVKIDENSLQLIASNANGALRDALSTFDKVVAFAGKTVQLEQVSEILNVLDHNSYLKICKSLRKKDIHESLLLFEEIIKRGFQVIRFIEGLAIHFRDILICKDEKAAGILEISQTLKDLYVVDAKEWTIDELVRAIEICENGRYRAKTSLNPRMIIELSLMQIASIDNLIKKKKSSIRINTLNTTESKQIIKENPLKGKSDKLDKDNKNEHEITNKSNNENINTLNAFSIQNFVESQKIDQKNKFSEKMPSDIFTEKEFLKYWRQFADNHKKKGNNVIFQALNFEDITIDKNKVYLECANKTSKSIIQEVLENLLQFLKEKLNNYSIDIQIKVSDKTREILPYLPEDKYSYFKKKNPLIKELKEELDLDFDY